ncbi:uncharacterized protein LOC105692529 [Athalia rosae]|uniref:uncharacterized protein LOC105692529 n=1 Tax=Athalia rosae TaxID=37344 RepID=UPI002033A7E0|nr:uncharacterized protein LOC105692529 [Athalia rosae]
MNSLTIALILIISACFVAARPRYLAIPLDDVEIIELSSLPRVSRHAESFIPVAVATVHAEEVEPSPRIERSTATHFMDFVDFGGHTGENGAFGWYADFPAHQ